MISMSRSFTRVALPYSSLFSQSTHEMMLFPGTPTPRNKCTREAFFPPARGPADYCHDRSGGREDPPNHPFTVLAFFYISSPLCCKRSTFRISISSTSRWILTSVEHLLGKNCNSCIIIMLRYALCPIRSNNCQIGIVRSTSSET
ncbi:hypothetical protein CY34DRAFT_216385 [Suillus luteus UH-Slu-Lm8-n1]|uniref:Uncharacterized protein n=1 Tax=Suillus luteus UH-Slu-Lm8-n1 TaxID=930992 RepID=A0A0D0ATM5_9AGAM|nr:hypothetical protein CY34DRAFT_216385 [Suillus luteus UH-Slu-Lm8-n1]